MSENFGRKQIARSTIRLNDIAELPSAQVIDGVTYIRNFNTYTQFGEGRFVIATPSVISANEPGDETQPNKEDDEEEDRQFWADNEMDSSEDNVQRARESQQRMAHQGSSVERDLRSKFRRKLKRTFNTVLVNKPRISTRKRRKADSVSDGNSNEFFVVNTKPPDWRFSNLPVAINHRSHDNDSSSDSDEDICTVRKKDWERRRREKELEEWTDCSTGTTSSGTDETRIKHDPPKLCVSCKCKFQNTVIVHNDSDTGHLCCCNACAKKLFEKGKPCPICRQRISRIINIK